MPTALHDLQHHRQPEKADPINICLRIASISTHCHTCTPWHAFPPHPSSTRTLCAASILPTSVTRKATQLWSHCCSEPSTERLLDATTPETASAYLSNSSLATTAESSKFPAGRKYSPTSSASNSARSLMRRRPRSTTTSTTTTRKRAPTSWSHTCSSTRARGPPRQCARAAHRVEREGLRWRLCGVGTVTASSGPRRLAGVKSRGPWCIMYVPC